MYEKIPFELRSRPQWVVWKYVVVEAGKPPTKVPYNPRGYKADTMDGTTWASFQDCVEVVGNYNGIGFVFSEQDEYCGIDLDKIMSQPKEVQDVHEQIFKQFDSYSEWSPSGEGIHIIVRGSVVSGRNSRSRACEIYSSGRYFTFTGNAINNVSIAERQELVHALWYELGGTNKQTAFINVEQFQRPQGHEDIAIYNTASNAHNGAKFLKLWAGEWQGDYPSQSEADISLVNILQFYTKNPEQIKRMFLLSGLGQRDKAKRADYLPRIIGRSFDRELPPIDFSSIPESPSTALDVAREAALYEEPAHNPFTAPPGLLGEIASFIYAAAPRPVPEAAIAGAIVMLAGIVGKAFNVNGTGLNHYILYLARTGRGKEQIASGVGRLMSELTLYCPAAADFKGAADFASGQGLQRMLQNSKTGGCCFSITGEFGLRMQQMASERASTSDKELSRVLFDIYSKSGKGQVYDGKSYSSADNNIKPISAPAFSMLGEGVPTSFYTSIDERTVRSGLLPRFTIIEYNGPRVDENSNHHLVRPTDELVGRLAYLSDVCLGRIGKNVICEVKLDPEATRMDLAFNKLCDQLINTTTLDVIADLWSRARLKAMKLAALISVGIDCNEPIVTADAYTWAKNVVEYETKAMVKKFETGELARGTDNLELGQLMIVAKMIHRWMTTPLSRNSTLKTKKEMYKDGVFYVNDIMMRCSNVPVFKLDFRKDLAQKVARAVEALKETNLIAACNVSDEAFTRKYGQIKARCVQVLDFELLCEFINKNE